MNMSYMIIEIEQLCGFNFSLENNHYFYLLIYFLNKFFILWWSYIHFNTFAFNDEVHIFYKKHEQKEFLMMIILRFRS